MFSWHAIPFARLVLPCSLGILIGFHHPVAKQIVIFTSITILLFQVIINKYLENSKRFNTQFINGIFLNTICVLVFAYFTYSFQDIYQSNHFSRIKGTKLIIGEIHEIQKENTNYSTFICQIISAVDSNFKCHKSTGKILLQYKKTTTECREFKCGDIIGLNSDYSEIKSALNEDDFDYQFYLKTKGIHHQLYTSNIYKLNLTNSSIWTWAQHIKQQCNAIIKSYIKHRREYGVAEALLLGYKYDIDKESTDIFAKTGTLHVLAVSGMHVGLIYGLLNLLLSFIKKRSNLSLFKVTIIISSLWAYALMSGFGSSILRATITFSLISLSELFTRKPHSINLLFASAFVIFLIDPLSLFDPGFQLSYTAVFGILISHQTIKKIVTPTNQLLKHIWDLCSISIAAQIFTLPLSLYYFHQFPCLFLIANIIIIPMTTIAIFGLILLIVCSFNSMIASNLGKCLEYLLKKNFEFAQLVSDHPLSTIDHIYIDRIELILLYLLSIILTIILVKNKPRLTLVLMIMLFILSFYSFILTLNKPETEISIVHYKKNEIFILRYKNEAVVVIPKNFENKRSKCIFITKNRISRLKIDKTIFVTTTKSIDLSNFKIYPRDKIIFFDRILTLPKNEQ